MPDDAFARTAYNICRWHHERYDGGGYPDGLQGEQIPIEAQVVGLADVYERLVSRPVDGHARTHSEVVQMICTGVCGASIRCCWTACRIWKPRSRVPCRTRRKKPENITPTGKCTGNQRTSRLFVCIKQKSGPCPQAQVC